MSKKNSSTTNKPLVACPNCCKKYASLSKHYAQRPLCIAMQTDSSLVSSIPKKHNLTNQFTSNSWATTDKICSSSTKQSSSITNNSTMNLNTFDGYDLNDIDSSFFDINPIPEEDNKKGKFYNYSNSISTTMSSYNSTRATSLTNDSKKRSSNGYDSFTEYTNPNDSKKAMHNISTQFHNVDVTLPSTFLTLQIANTTLEYTPSDDDDENSYIKSIHSNINENQESYNKQNIVNHDASKNTETPPMSTVSSLRTIPFYDSLLIGGNDSATPDDHYMYDFRGIQMKLIQQNNHLDIDNHSICSITLLKIMQKGNIPNCHYESLIKWHETTSTLLTPTTTSGQCGSFLNPKFSQIGEMVKDKSRIIKDLDKLLSDNKIIYSLSPVHSLIQLPSKRLVKISTFRLTAIITSLLSDPEFMTNNDTNHFNNKYYRQPTLQKQIPNDERTYGDIHHGYAFHNAHKLLCKEPRDVLVPLIAFIDGTPIDAYGNLKLEVVMISLGIATQSFRNKNKAWRILGYIPSEPTDDEDDSERQTETKRQKSTNERKDYHHMLSHIMADIVVIENSGGILWNILDENGQIETVRLRIYYCVTNGDAVGHDKSSDRFISYGKKVVTLCRDCNCPNDKLNDPSFFCKFTVRSDITSKTDAQLKKISYYKVVNNAFDKLHFGGDNTGINGNSPCEPLHQNNKGVVIKLNIFIDDCLTTPGKKFLNEMAKYIAKNWHRQSARDYYDIQLFSQGIDRSQLTGGEVISQTFIIYLCLIQTYTMNQLISIEKNQKKRYKTKKKKIPNKQQNKEVSPVTTNNDDDDIENIDTIFESTENDTEMADITSQQVQISKMYYPKIAENIDQLKKWIKLLELTLCMDVWLHQKEIKWEDLETPQGPVTIDGKHPMPLADSAFRDYLRLYTEVVQEPMGNGTLTAKIHWLLHIAHYCRKFGPTNVISTQRPESNLSPMVKGAARATQMRPSTFTQQSTERYFERVMIERSHDILVRQGIIPPEKEEKNKPQDEQSPFNGMSLADDSTITWHNTGRYKIKLNDDWSIEKIQWGSATKHICHNQKFLSDIISRLQKEDYQLESNFIDCFTCLTVKNSSTNTRHLFRADPYFYKKVWLDWCMVTWTTNDEDSDIEDEDKMKIADQNLCRLIMFIDPSNMKFRKETTHHGKYWAVVRCTKEDKRKKGTHRPNHECRLISSHKTEEYIRIIPCDSISNTAFVVSDVKKIVKKNNIRTYIAEEVLLLKPKKDWPKMFIDGKWNK